MSYIALIHKNASSDYGVSFADFPGCVTAGKTLDEAKYLAKEALKGHIDLMREMGEFIPEASSLESIMQDPTHKEAVAFLVDTPSPKVVRVNVCFSEEILQVIDDRAHELRMSRSAYLASLALEKEQNKSNSH